MQISNENKSEGYYGADGEFYPNSQPQQTQTYSNSNSDTLYPKRPKINYTTTAFKGEITPVNNNLDDKLSGYAGPTKYCKFCGQKIPEQAVICTHCGCQVEEIRQVSAQPQSQPQPVVINNNVNNRSNAVDYPSYPNMQAKSKWLAFLLCFFGGCIGLHKFYEGKIGMGILYLCTGGLFGVGWVIDIIIHLFKTDPYYI